MDFLELEFSEILLKGTKYVLECVYAWNVWVQLPKDTLGVLNEDPSIDSKNYPIDSMNPPAPTMSHRLEDAPSFGSVGWNIVRFPVKLQNPLSDTNDEVTVRGRRRGLIVWDLTSLSYFVLIRGVMGND